MLRILVIDERVAEVAYKLLYQGEPKASRFFWGAGTFEGGQGCQHLFNYTCLYSGRASRATSSVDRARSASPSLPQDRHGSGWRRYIRIYGFIGAKILWQIVANCRVEPVRDCFDAVILHYGLLEGDGLLKPCLDAFAEKNL